MKIRIYCGNIGVPPKCGSRFFKENLNNYWGEPKELSFNDKNYNLDYIIIRNPLSHLKSALKTEILPFFDNRIEISMILHSFSTETWGGTHFNPNFCQIVYNKWKQSKWKLKVVDLSNLSKFVEEKLHHIEFDESLYDFHEGFNLNIGYKNKEEIWDRCIELFPNKMKRLIEYATEDLKWYDALLNDDRTLTTKITYTDGPPHKSSIILYCGSTIEESYSKNNQIKIYYTGILEVGNYLYIDDDVLTEAQSQFYYDDILGQVFHLDSSSNIGMIIKITLRPKSSIILYCGSTIEESYSKNNQIKIYYTGILEVGNYLYIDDDVLTEAQSQFYYNDKTNQIFHLGLTHGMITKITRKLL